MGKNNRKPSSFRKNPRVQFDKRGSFKKGKRQNFNFEKSTEDFNDETVYRILCPVKKIGSVIGKGGDIIKGLRDETHAKIKVGESVPGTEERVVIIFSSSTIKPKIDDISEDQEPKIDVNSEDQKPKIDDSNENQENPENNDTAEEEHDPMKPHCPAQHALLKVHDRIAEDDGLFGGRAREENNDDDVVTARLLVPSNQVGCLLGKGGHVIQKLRTETCANIRILPQDHLPACAMSTDELVQISGISAIVKRALYEVSTLLHQNPRPPMKNPMPDDGQDFYPPSAPIGSMPPQGNPMSQRNPGFRGPPPMPWGNEFPRFPPGNESAEFSMKILCPTERIGVVIGKGGMNVRQIQHETGTSIHVEDSMPEAEERAILVSSFDAPWNPISPTIEAILQLQVRTNVISEEGIITTRLLVPSSKVGCLLGQGGHIINEMRRRSHADIRVISKEGKPNYASTDEELVQVSGNVDVARDALTEISSRLRMRSLEGINNAVEPSPLGPSHGFGRPESFSERRNPQPGMIGARSGHRKRGGREFEVQSYPAQPTPGFPHIDSSMKVKIPNSALSSVLGVGGSNISNIGQMSGAKVKLNDPQAGGSECVVEIHGSFEQMDAAQNLLQSFITSSVQNFNTHQHVPHSSAAQNFNSQPQPSSYASVMPNSSVQQQQNSYASTQSLNAQQNQSPYTSSMPSLNAQQHQSPYGSAVQNYNTQQQSSYASAVPNYSAYQQQQQQSPYASAVQSYNPQQQQQSPYASAGQSYNPQQQQQSPYASAVQSYNPQQQEQSSYAPTLQSFDGQQQQVPYQY